MNAKYDIDKILESIRELRAAQRVTDEQMRKTDEQMRRTDVQVGRLTGAWGRFSEDLMAPSIVAYFKDQGIEVHRHAERLRARDNGRVLAEYDVVLFGNSEEGQATVILVSVKSRVGTEDVKDLVKQLESFFEYLDEYRGHRLLGVIAGIGFPEGVRKCADKAGLFVMQSSQGMATMLNRPNFKPRVWTYREPSREDPRPHRGNGQGEKA